MPRVDIDGDLAMDSADANAPAGRGGRGRARGDVAGRSGGEDPRRNNAKAGGPARGIFGGAALQKAIARSVASGAAVVKAPPRAGIRMEGVVREAAESAKRAGRGRNLDDLVVLGLKQSKAATNPDGGVKDLLAFLERKATGTDAAASDAIRIRKVCCSVRSAGHTKARATVAFFGSSLFRIHLHQRTSCNRVIRYLPREPLEAGDGSQSRVTYTPY